MMPLPNRSPFDDGEIVVTRFYCPESDVTVEGRFEISSPFAALSPEQIDFIEIFVRCEGKLSRMEGELSLSYPTIRSRLHDIIRALGYEPGKDEGPVPDEQGRRALLDQLDRGEISFDQAMQRLGSTD